MTVTGQAHNTVVRHRDAEQAIGEASCPDCVSFQAKKVAHRQEWLRRWGFPPESVCDSERKLSELEDELDDHFPNFNGELERYGDEKWKQLSPATKLFFALEYHLRVAPGDWWRRYFRALREQRG